MKITLQQLRRIIKEEVAAAGGRPVRVGRLTASIGGDPNYTDVLEVSYDPSTDTVTVAVTESSPAGGMDSFSSALSRASFKQEFPSTDLKGVMASIKQVIGNNEYSFKQYGVPSKKFVWADKTVGPSIANLTSALAFVKGKPVKEVAARTGGEPDMTLLSKIARLRPLPETALKQAELAAVDVLKQMGYVRWDLGSKGWTTTPAGLDALGRR